MPEASAPPPGRGSAQASARNDRWRPLLLGLLSLAVALLLAELLVRLSSVGPDVALVPTDHVVLSSDPVLRYELRAGAEDGATRINTAGFRDREFPEPKPDGVFRIVAIGDSVTFGFDVAQDEAYPKQLERELNAAAEPGAPRYEVLNFGVSGYNLPQSVARLRSLALRYAPDLVVYGYCLNDSQASSLEADLLERARDQEQRSLQRSRAIRLVARSRIFQLVYALLQPRDPAAQETELPEDPGFAATAAGQRDRYFRGLHRRQEPRQRLEAGLAALGQITRDTGVPVWVAIFPLFVDEDDYPLRDVHAAVAARARAHGLEAVDLQPAFEAARGAEALASDLVHPTTLGHQLAARTLLRELATREPRALAPRGGTDAGI